MWYATLSCHHLCSPREIITLFVGLVFFLFSFVSVKILPIKSFQGLIICLVFYTAFGLSWLIISVARILLQISVSQFLQEVLDVMIAHNLE